MATSNLYTNTMVFSIIAGVVTLLVLLILFFVPISRKFAWGIVVYELGIIGIMIYTIVSIFMYERDMKKKLQAEQSQIILVDTCPDYFSNKYVRGATSNLINPGTSTPGIFTKPGVNPKGSQNTVVCSNNFIMKKDTLNDSTQTLSFIKRGCKPTSADDSSCFIDNRLTRDGMDIHLADINTGQTASTLCNMVNTKDASSTTYPNIPWTDIKARCASMGL